MQATASSSSTDVRSPLLPKDNAATASSPPTSPAPTSRPRTATDTLHLSLRGRHSGTTRTVAYAQYGAPTGFPLIYLHGFPSSRLEASILHRAALKRGIRVLAPDRPGFGESEFVEGFDVRSVVEDVRAFVKGLGLEKWAVLGLSGGGPYALGIARWVRREEEGCVGVGIACGSPYWWEGGTEGMPWWSRGCWWLERWCPGVLRGLVWGAVAVGRWVGGMGWAERALEGAIGKEREKQRGTGAEVFDEDRTVQEARKEVVRMTFEGFRQGVGPMMREFHVFVSDWGFKCKDVEYDKVYLWHGKKDINAPISGARYIAGALPHAELREYDGNHAEIITQIDDMLDTLVPEQTRSSAEQ